MRQGKKEQFEAIIRELIEDLVYFAKKECKKKGEYYQKSPFLMINQVA